MTSNVYGLLLQAESETLTVTMNETIPVLLVAGVATTGLIVAFIVSSIISLIPSKK